MPLIVVKGEGNNSVKYDGKFWTEQLRYVVSVNGLAVNRKQPTKIKRGDRVILFCPPKGRQKTRTLLGTVYMSEENLSSPSSSTDVVEEISGQKSQSRKRKSVAQGATINVKKKKGQRTNAP